MSDGSGSAAISLARRAALGLAALYPLVLIALIWEGAARFGLVRPLFLPAFTDVVGQLAFLAASGELWPPLLVSLYRGFAGLGLAVLVGVPLGILMAQNRWVNWFFDPLVTLGMPTPKLAFIPIFTLWFGIDHMAKIMLVAVTCIFPLVVAAAAGARAVPEKQVWAARAMGLGDLRLLAKVILPGALPALMSGLRVAVPIALLTVFTAEMVAGGGLGGALVLAQRYFESETFYAYLLVMLVVGYLLDSAILRLKDRLLHWAVD